MQFYRDVQEYDDEPEFDTDSDLEYGDDGDLFSHPSLTAEERNPSMCVLHQATRFN